MSEAQALILGSLLAFGFAAASTLVLARRARAWGFADSGLGVERKLQARAVPVVGGASILLGLSLALVCTSALGSAAIAGDWVSAYGLVGLPVPSPWTCALSLLLAFGAGLWDDIKRPAGIPAPTKLALQLLAGIPLAIDCASQAQPFGPWSLAIPLVAMPLASAVALNAINTFDNADGAATGIGILALAAPAPMAAAALLGFLPFNLWSERHAAPSERESGPPLGSPRAYLGDAGSHLLGMLILLHPPAWPVLILPLVDLARVSLARLRAGLPVWRGDRRHLAHRLERRGLGRVTVLATLLLLAAPSALLGYRLGAGELALGCGLTALGYLALSWALQGWRPGASAPVAVKATAVDWIPNRRSHSALTQSRKG